MQDSNMRTVSKETYTGVVLLISAVTMIAIICVSVWIGGWLGWTIFTLATGAFISDGIKDVSSVPPKKAMPRVFDRLVNSLIGPGLIFNPFSGLIVAYTLVENDLFAIRFTSEEKILGGDRAGVKIPVAIYAQIDPENPVQVVTIGEIIEAKKRLQEQLDKCLRSWIARKDIGPQGADDARQMTDEAVNQMIDELIQVDIGKLSGNISWEAILLAEMKQRPLSTKEQELLCSFNQLSDPEKARLQQKKEDRVELIQGIKRGNRALALHSLGIVVKQIVVGNIEPDDKTQKAMDQVTEAQYNAEAQRPAMKSLAEEADLIMKNDPTITKQAAFRIALIRRGMIKESINRIEFPDETSTAAGNALGGILAKAAAMLFGMMKGENK